MKPLVALLCSITGASLLLAQYGFPLGDFVQGLPQSKRSQDFQPSEPFMDASGNSWTFFLYKGMANHTGVGKGYRGHTGEDWAVNYGTDVYAIGPGQVVFAKDLGGAWKKVVIIRHTLTDSTVVYSQYAHLSEILVAPTDPPITDPRSAPIGKSGSAGSGPHLHWEVKQFSSPSSILAGPGYTQLHSAPNTNSVTFNGTTYLRPSAFLAQTRLFTELFNNAPDYSNNWARSWQFGTPVVTYNAGDFHIHADAACPAENFFAGTSIGFSSKLSFVGDIDLTVELYHGGAGRTSIGIGPNSSQGMWAVLDTDDTNYLSFSSAGVVTEWKYAGTPYMNRWITLRVQLAGDHVNFYADGVLLETLNAPPTLPTRSYNVQFGAGSVCWKTNSNDTSFRKITVVGVQQ